MKRFNVLSPTAILGYGFPEASFEKGLSLDPDVIGVDAGSTDPGPYYIGSGKSFTDRTAVKRDLRLMLKAGVSRGIPVIVGSAGGSGAAPHLEWCRKIILEIAEEESLSFSMAVVTADVSREKVLEWHKKGQLRSLSPSLKLDEEKIRATTNIVGQMGVEPIIEALKKGAQVVLCGRAYDPAVFAAPAIAKGFDHGVAIHMGKILECAAIAADPGSGSDCVLGRLEENSFTLIPLSGERRFTATSTAAHTLYEKSDPYNLPGPGGVLKLQDTVFDAHSDGSVTVRGSRHIEDKSYTIKLEGARPVGFRTISIAGNRDPVFIRDCDSILKTVEQRVKGILDREKVKGKVFFKVYGRDGVPGLLFPSLQTKSEISGHEICVVIEALADTQEKASTICSLTRSTLLHYGYPGRISTAGNLAFPFSPSDIPMGEAWEFSIYHLIEVDPLSLFPIRIEQVGKEAKK